MLGVLLDVLALELGRVLELGSERGELLFVRLGRLSDRRKLADPGLKSCGRSGEGAMAVGWGSA